VSGELDGKRCPRCGAASLVSPDRPWNRWCTYVGGLGAPPCTWASWGDIRLAPPDCEPAPAPDWLPEGAHFVVVTERDIDRAWGHFDRWGQWHGHDHTSGPIVGETSIPEGSSYPEVTARVRQLGTRYGRARIARLVFLPEGGR
jgi:hypothetical protein